MNRLTIIGNLTRDPETRTAGDTNVCNFTVAVNRTAKADSRTDYFRVAAWGAMGEACQKYLNRGRKVAVVGSVNLEQYTNANGENRAALVVHASDVEFLSPRGEGTAPAEIAKNGATAEWTEVTDEELPF